ncbi:hypothetical protein K501DRAFT_174327 [Backusella circina FSU 941]|nr:hypothetical protein K501DRAFT_174327 [Backusella circina FSU 941]
MKPSSLWSKSKVNNNHGCTQAGDSYFTENPGLTTHNTSSSSSLLSAFSIGKKAAASPSAQNVALKETARGDVYKLSIVQDGSYIPPSPGVEGKRDHWIDVKEDIMNFNLPDSMTCLTTQYNEKHDFFTPYTFVHTQPYVLPVDDLSDSSDSDSSLSRSSSIY